MFKYISEILSKFNGSERVVALIIIFFSIITIIIAPKIIETMTYDNSDLQIRLERQNGEIIFLNDRVNELSKKIVDNKRECVNEIIRRETEILEMINEIDLYIRKMKNENRVVHLDRQIILNDTVEVLMSTHSIMEPINFEVNKDEKLIKMIENLKNNVSMGLVK